MKAPPGMRANRIVLHILLVALRLGNCQATGDVTANCTVELQITRGFQYRSEPGGTLSIHCPVKYCTEKPHMNWCKIEGQDCLFLKDEPTRNAAWMEENVFVLKFLSIHQNDSGFYRCRAIVGRLSSESHVVKVDVQEVATDDSTDPPSKEFADATNATGDPQQPGTYNKKWIIYILSSLGGLCLLILGCLCLLCCLQGHKVKHKTTPVTSQKKMNMLNRPTGAPSHTDNTTPVPSDGSALYYCSMASQQQQSGDSTIYDNHVPHWNSSKAASGTASESASVGSYSPSMVSQDVLVYASLNHSARVEKVLRTEQDVEVELTEYATICVKK
ncbi:B- and T-lymphocyte attenuator [Carettochelys insculpta]|uniref:B- and T-lymphocyte attenuator n=1 Tax=Carettochelys insculpta TaxID=44489 RepID=UPI003EB72CB2